MVPPSLRILPVDLSDPSATRAATEKAKALFGEIDILVSNAGISVLNLWSFIMVLVFNANFFMQACPLALVS